MGKRSELTGLVFGRLTVEKEAGRSEDRMHVMWLCHCVCGTNVKASSKVLKNGTKKSCGCLKQDVLIKRNTTHGHKHSVTYNIWQAMLNRCRNPNVKAYHNYGGRGIKVCERWLNFENFIEDMGERPPALTLEREDVNGEYSPDNCSWKTYTQQNNNRRDNLIVQLIATGEMMTLAQAARQLGVPYGSLRYRVHANKSTQVKLCPH